MQNTKKIVQNKIKSLEKDNRKKDAEIQLLQSILKALKGLKEKKHIKKEKKKLIDLEQQIRNL